MKAEKVWTRNEAVEMMHNNTADALKGIADFCKIKDMKRDEILDYLIELSEELAAMALVVALRDELNFEKPKED